MDTISLKQYIFEKEKVEFVLKEIGCHDIKYHSSKDYFTCANYDGDNVNAVNVKNNPYLNVRNWTRGKGFEGNSDIITLVQYNKKLSFVQAVKYLHELFDLDFNFKKRNKKETKKFDYLTQWDITIFSKHRCQKKINVHDIQVLDNELLHDYVPILHIDWFREGIMPWTMKKFGLAYSYKRKRIIIPHRYWMTGELVGINARTTIKNFDEFGISKYWITPSYQKNLNVFGLYENYDSIQQAGYVVVYEAEKSVLKRDSLTDATGVALSGHFMSDEQTRILTGLNVEIIIAMDNDVPKEEIWHICEKFYNVRKVSYMYDTKDLLNEKSSPADGNNKVYNYLFKHRITYDLKKHEKYLAGLKTSQNQT